jgi:hypothetical protein
VAALSEPLSAHSANCAQASLTMAIAMPMSTNTTIAACIQIQVGDMTLNSLLCRECANV